MRASRALVGVWAAYAVAWAVPVVEGGVTLPEGLPGWQAFRAAASPLWPYEGVRYETWYWAILAVASAASNLLMIATPWLARFGHAQPPRRVGAAAAMTAFLVNGHWFALRGGSEDLRIGYYLWWFSFSAVAWLLWRASSHEREK